MITKVFVVTMVTEEALGFSTQTLPRAEAHLSLRVKFNCNEIWKMSTWSIKLHMNILLAVLKLKTDGRSIFASASPLKLYFLLRKLAALRLRVLWENIWTK